VLRQALLSGGQLASYDTGKQMAKANGMHEGPLLHIACGFTSGLVAQACCMPADVIKVKVLSGQHGVSVWNCLRTTVGSEGLGGLYRGFVPAVSRQCPVILVQFPLIEQIRYAMGLSYM